MISLTTLAKNSEPTAMIFKICRKYAFVSCLLCYLPAIGEAFDQPQIYT